MKIRTPAALAVLIGLALALASSGVVRLDGAEGSGTKGAGGGQLRPQVTCPIMGGKINKDLYVDADGKRIYVCCAGCVARVGADPQRCLGVLAARGEAPGSVPAATQLKPQTVCPIMGGKIDKGLYVDADGKRIYVCCAGCLPRVKADPQKYLGLLAAKGVTPETIPPPQASAAEDKRPTVTTATLAVLIRAKVPMTILDARGVLPGGGPTIPGAVAMTPAVGLDEAAPVLPDKDALIVTYCGGPKCPLSSMLAEQLHKLGYTNILEYRDGITGWTAAGLPVKGEKTAR